MLHKKTIEAQFVSYADKLDAYNESLHEIFAGNISLLESVMFYAQAFANFPKKYPALADFMADKTSPLTYLDDRTWRYRSRSIGKIRASRSRIRKSRSAKRLHSRSTTNGKRIVLEREERTKECEWLNEAKRV